MDTNEIQETGKKFISLENGKGIITPENVVKGIAKTGGAVGGTLIGGASGAAIGSFLGPVGAAAGFVVGITGGAFGGWKVAKAIQKKMD